MQQVVVTTGARLHFGLLSADTTARRQYGGVGLMVDEPGFRVAISQSNSNLVVGPQSVSERVSSFLSQWNATADTALPALKIEVTSHMPSHGGMGSGTQLALAIGRGVVDLLGDDISTEQLAIRLGRGKRSAIGIHGFQHGGFIVDAGKSDGDRVGQMAARYDWPQEWPIVLVTLDESAGLSGEAEAAAFRGLAPMDRGLVAQLSVIVEDRLMPAISNRQHAEFAEALGQYGDLVGDYFGPAQGGRYADQRMRQLVAELRQNDVSGIVQSSWGPTVCIVCADMAVAEGLVGFIQQTDFDGRARIVKGLNRGAMVDHSDFLAIH